MRREEIADLFARIGACRLIRADDGDDIILAITLDAVDRFIRGIEGVGGAGIEQQPYG